MSARPGFSIDQVPFPVEERPIFLIAVLNVLTDFTSRPLGYFSPDAVIDSLQKKSGEWIDAFPAAINANSFRWETYLDGYLQQAKLLQDEKSG